VRLVANPHYRDRSRGPYLKVIVFRNDVPPAQALELICTTEGEFDIVTEVPPADAAKVKASKHAKLVSIDAVRSVAGVVNRSAEGCPLADVRARQALNHAIDRKKLVAEAMAGHADSLGGLTPPCVPTYALSQSPYSHDPHKAAELWRAAGGSGASRPLRIAAFADWGEVARSAAEDLRKALGVAVEVAVLDREGELRARRRMAERAPPEWDVLILMQGCQAADGAPLELRRAFVGDDGEYRAGPPVPAFDALYADLLRQTAPLAQGKVALAMDRLVYDEALALFLCAPHALYAVNREVEFTPYRTTFELAECRVGKGHWSRRRP